MSFNVTGGEVNDFDIRVTNTTGKDITSDTFKIGLSTSQSVPPDWKTPDTVQVQDSNNIVLLSMFVTDVDPGVYYAWAQIVDGDRTILVCCLNAVVEVL